MNPIQRRTTVVMAVAASLMWHGSTTATAAANTTSTPPPKPTLTAFANEAELKAWFDTLRKRLNQAQARAKVEVTGTSIAGNVYASLQSVVAPAPASAPSQSAAAKAFSKDSNIGAVAESVTNVQAAGVDEGGIVKVHGDHLVVLRRGRLFTVSLKGGAPVSRIEDELRTEFLEHGADSLTLEVVVLHSQEAQIANCLRAQTGMVSALRPIQIHLCICFKPRRHIQLLL